MSVTLEMPPPLRGRGPTLSTLHEVELILRQAEAALSLNEVKRRMSARAVRHETVRTIVDEFRRLGLVVEGEKGVLWTFSTNRDLWENSTPL